MSLALAPAHYILLIPLPEAAAVILDAWAEEAQGASIPAFGWHLTLAPAFVPRVSEAVLDATIEHALASIASFPIALAATRIVPDKTRPDYAAVFLECVEAAVDGCEAVADLQSRMTGVLASIATSLVPALGEAPFRPHITLALAVSDQEANRLARFARSRKLSAEFVCDRVRLLKLESTSGATAQPWQHDFYLHPPSQLRP